MRNLKSLSSRRCGTLLPFDLPAGRQARETKKIYFSGFTLFELLITISIIGILTAIATISFSSAQKKGRDARRMQDVKNIQTAAEQYYSLNNTYPSATNTDFSDTLVGIGGTGMLQVWPIGPKGTGDTYGVVEGLNNTGGYCVCAFLEDTTKVNSNSICNFAAATKRYYCVKSQQ